MEELNLDEILFNDSYSFEQLISRVRDLKLTIKELRDQLIQHQQNLNQRSVELFNNSYDRFYKLSCMISCLAEPLQQVIHPLEIFRTHLSKQCQTHSIYLEEINSKLESLKETSRNKLYARKLIVLMRRRDRLDKQIEVIDWSVAPLDRVRDMQSRVKRDECPEFKSKCDLIERVSVELYLIISEVKSIQPSHDELITIKNSLATSLEGRQNRFDRWFEEIFLRSIDLQDEIFVDLIVRTYEQRHAIPEFLRRCQLLRERHRQQAIEQPITVEHPTVVETRMKEMSVNSTCPENVDKSELVDESKSQLDLLLGKIKSLGKFI